MEDDPTIDSEVACDQIEKLFEVTVESAVDRLLDAEVFVYRDRFCRADEPGNLLNLGQGKPAPGDKIGDGN